MCVVAVLASNMDRIVTAIKTDENDSDAPFDSDKEFGHEMLDHFALNREWAPMYFNWGNNGGIPIYVMEAAEKLYRSIADCPECFFSFDRQNELTQSLQLLAEYLGIEEWEDLVFVDNASQGINTVLRSLSAMLWSTKCSGNTSCSVLRFNTAYPMVRNAVQWFDASIASTKPQEIVFDLTLEMLRNTSFLLDNLRQFIQVQNNVNNSIYLAFISHIISSPAVILDIKAINALFREYDIITCVDGAHAMGQIALDMTEMNIDIYIANGYKWFYSPRSSALLYVQKEFQPLLYPIVISTRNPFSSSFQERFSWLGLKDYVPYIMMREALAFRQEIGEDKIVEYIHNMAMEGGNRVAEIWGTELYIAEEYVGALVSVVLPPNNLTGWSSAYAAEYKLFVRVDAPNMFGDMIARFSAQIFHELEDWERIAYAILDIINEDNQRKNAE